VLKYNSLEEIDSVEEEEDDDEDDFDEDVPEESK
jgi:hypothetical protein